MRAHTVGILVFDGVKMLDVAGPAEVFAEANLSGTDYRIRYLSATGDDVRSSIGMRVPADAPADEAGRLDTALIAGGEAFPAEPVPENLRTAAAVLAERSGRIASICTGAFVLGAAGLLDGKRATTHWKHARELARRHPSAEIRPDAIFVRDGTTYTSAGVTAGIDLALALLEEDHGPALTRTVAKSLVVYMQRAGGQSQFSAALLAPTPRTPVLRHVVDTVKADPAGSYGAGHLARLAGVSPRHLTRLFREELGTTPAKFVELVRFDTAKALLDAGHTVTRAAQLAGFGTPESLRRSFITHLSISPLRYQRRFTSTTGRT
ncbi:GlxA family transcriptional regulator [Streptomyces sp. TS71-3]|uniref:GlxA family transcriptional regulator n=1 Tax=Streptomyces sp. TS71-3 TaxID=2733862 RepID=UPI001B0D8A33|nr:DJ-1/PfpI family protein [Streptomyces sp. TS71-3]GHJ36715.1 AraC family transcriptional regulator [Streptomyces sp. TS71-3]